MDCQYWMGCLLCWRWLFCSFLPPSGWSSSWVNSLQLHLSIIQNLDVFKETFCFSKPIKEILYTKISLRSRNVNLKKILLLGPVLASLHSIVSLCFQGLPSLCHPCRFGVYEDFQESTERQVGWEISLAGFLCLHDFLALAKQENIIPMDLTKRLLHAINMILVNLHLTAKVWYPINVVH